jgi:hypothetical protein
MLSGGKLSRRRAESQSQSGTGPQSPPYNLMNRVVQKASFRSPEFIGFFAPISKIDAGVLPTGN